jgi:hypothetical protein
MRFMKLVAVIACMLVLAAPAQAHHSFAMFDKEKVVTIKGVVSKVEWKNPHVFIFLAVPDGKGGTIQYAVECNSPNVLMRTGWKAGTVKAGDAISIGLYLLRDGRPGGLLDTVTLANGETLKG